MNFLQILKALAVLVPLLIDVIRAVEDAIPGQGKGEAKLAMVREMIEAIYAAGSDMTVPFGKMWPVISNLINIIVAGFNKNGVFVKE